MTTRVREIDHSGDVGLEARAATFAGLIEALSAGLMALRVSGPVRARERLDVGVEARGVEAAVVDWLNELVTTMDIHAWAGASASARCEPADPDPRARDAVVRVTGGIEGEPLDPTRHAVRFDVKAATWHGLDVRRGDDGAWRARVIFDL